MKNSTSLRRRNQFMLFTYTAGMFLFCFLCVICGLDYPLTTPIACFMIGVVLNIIFFTKKINERLIAITTVILLNVTGICTVVATNNPYYLTFLILGLFMVAMYFSFLLNILMGILVIAEIGAFVCIKFPYLAERLSNEEIFWITINATFLIVFSIVQSIYLYVSNKSIEKKNDSMEKEFESKEGYLKLFFENAKDSIAVFDLDGKIINVNPAFVKLYGWTIEESVGKHIPLVPPENYELSQERINDMVGGMSYDLLQTKDMRKDGTLFDAEITLSPILDQEGKVIATSVITRDVSYRKEAEKLRVQSEKLKMAGEIAAGVAHEVRNPLSVISGFVQMMNEDKDSPYAFYTNLIEAEIDRINLIIGEFLVLSKPHAHDTKPFNLSNVLRDILALHKLELKVKNITLNENWGDTDVYINGESNQIKQVFINILKNAVEAIESEGHIEFSISTDAKNVQISIADNGIGMKQEVVDHIFQPFYTTKEKGTGLGMMITEKIVHEHEGDIKIHSTYGKGTEFILTFPLASPSETQA